VVAALKKGASLSLGVDHENYKANTGALAGPVRASLLSDLA
jgi:hypothetical protein